MVEPAPGVDLEVFKLGSPYADDLRKPDSLINIFNSLETKDDLENKSVNAPSSSSAQNMDAKFSEASEPLVLFYSCPSKTLFTFISSVCLVYCTIMEMELGILLWGHVPHSSCSNLHKTVDAFEDNSGKQLKTLSEREHGLYCGRMIL
ncbi:hypothetical protein WN944_008174 [Citrus x changshan-huyou]|uniref:Uncharacterized protein n=1 Tax=Citrus x changshan-huyou TaxID=2935761 RepID=A0AAP0QYN3_9ROSI